MPSAAVSSELQTTVLHSPSPSIPVDIMIGDIRATRVSNENREQRNRDTIWQEEGCGIAKAEGDSTVLTLSPQANGSYDAPSLELPQHLT